MASVIDAIRTLTNDKLLIPKLALLLVPVLFLFFIGEEIFNFPVLGWAIAYYFVGYLIVTFHKAIKDRDLYFPNPITSVYDVIIRGLGGMLCIIPITVGIFFLILWFENLQNTVAEIKYLAIIFALLIWLAIVFVQLTLYAKEYNLLHAFKFKTISDVGGEFMIQILKLFIQIAICIGIPAYFVFLAGNSAFGETPSTFVIFKLSLYAFTTLFSYLVSIQFLIQLYEELIISDEDMDYLHL
ncbi:hypothetical protein IKQ26_06110 [bacterium]|nr:hypothetical protein [bacterium]